MFLSCTLQFHGFGFAFTALDCRENQESNRCHAIYDGSICWLRFLRQVVPADREHAEVGCALTNPISATPSRTVQTARMKISVTTMDEREDDVNPSPGSV